MHVCVRQEQRRKGREGLFDAMTLVIQRELCTRSFCHIYTHWAKISASITVTRAQKSISAGSDGGGSSGSSAGGGGSSYSPDGGGSGGCERDGRQTTSQQARTRARARTHTERASERAREIGDGKKMDIDKTRLGKLANTKRESTINGRPQLTT